MPRPLHLEPHFSADELKARYRASGDPVESRRWHLLWLVHTQTTLTDAAKAVGFHYDYARVVVKDYNRDGADGLRNRRKDQRPQQSRSLLNPKQLEDLEARLQSPPDDDGVWSGPKVAQVIAEVTGVAKVWPQRGWDYLKRLEQSLQVPSGIAKVTLRPRTHLKKLPERKAELEQQYPEALVEAWSFDVGVDFPKGTSPRLETDYSQAVGQSRAATVGPG